MNKTESIFDRPNRILVAVHQIVPLAQSVERRFLRKSQNFPLLVDSVSESRLKSSDEPPRMRTNDLIDDCQAAVAELNDVLPWRLEFVQINAPQQTLHVVELRTGAVAGEVDFSEAQLSEFSFDLVRNAAERGQLRFTAVNEIGTPHVHAQVFAAQGAPVRLKAFELLIIHFSTKFNLLSHQSNGRAFERGPFHLLSPGSPFGMRCQSPEDIC